jgi:hypothetical protein
MMKTAVVVEEDDVVVVVWAVVWFALLARCR